MDKNELNTGDILLFHNKLNCKSCYRCIFSCFTGLIMCCTKSKYSHIAIVIKDPTYFLFSVKKAKKCHIRDSNSGYRIHSPGS